MENDKNPHIYQDNDVIEITLDWYTPMAWFLLMFSVFWVVFLAFFYSGIMATGAPLFAMLFPLIHVAAGIGMSYYTACLFFNKTYIDVVDGMLTVHHDPIPWWRGAVSMPVANIEQLYVQEKVSQGKNGSTSRSYVLRAKLQNGSDKAVVNIGTSSSEKLQIIESKLEAFMGIKDRPMKGEYGVGGKVIAPQHPQPRQQRRGFAGGILESIYLSKTGSFISKQGASLKMISSTQFDWNDGNSDKLFQLLSEDKNEELLLVSQNKALLNVREEEQIPLAKTYSIGFNFRSPSSTLKLEGKEYTVTHHQKGLKFISGVSDPIKVEQWTYASSDGLQSLRIVGQDGALIYYKGQALDVDDFNDIFDLNQRPAPSIEEKPRPWEDEDFV